MMSWSLGYAARSFFPSSLSLSPSVVVVVVVWYMYMYGERGWDVYLCVLEYLCIIHTYYTLSRGASLGLWYIIINVTSRIHFGAEECNSPRARSLLKSGEFIFHLIPRYRFIIGFYIVYLYACFCFLYNALLYVLCICVGVRYIYIYIYGIGK